MRMQRRFRSDLPAEQNVTRVAMIGVLFEIGKAIQNRRRLGACCPRRCGQVHSDAPGGELAPHHQPGGGFAGR